MLDAGDVEEVVLVIVDDEPFHPRRSMPPYGWATYRTETPRSGKMSRDMRSSARKPTNPTATTIAKSEIGRRNANDTKFIVPAQAVAARGRPNAPGRHRRYRDI
jgi:hypothetical protein